jgi:hypothetical protein
VEFKDYSLEQIREAARNAGFEDVRETAEGATATSIAMAQILNTKKHGIYISSACPSAVQYITRYKPHLREHIIETASPMLLHSRMLKQEYGEQTTVVFAGPCIAKKLESDSHPQDVAIALTFQELRRILVLPESHNPSTPINDNSKSLISRTYPLEFGMLKTMEPYLNCDIETHAISGLGQISDTLNEINALESDFVFIEMMACEGGCISGPGMTSKSSLISARRQILNKHEFYSEEVSVPEHSRMNIPENRVPIRRYSEAEIRDALRQIGKQKPEDELNCDGCGYSRCTIMAEALLDGIAEPAMCVSFMRKLASKKANALLKCMPSGVVIVDSKLKIIECNRPFCTLMGKDTEEVYDSLGGLKGADLSKMIDFSELFIQTLKSGKETRRNHLHFQDKTLSVNMFSIEPGQVVGAVLQDTTEMELHRESVSKNAEQVLQNSLNTVQNIACQLGEYMADTEILLRAIANCYKDTESEDKGEDS